MEMNTIADSIGWESLGHAKRLNMGIYCREKCAFISICKNRQSNVAIYGFFLDFALRVRFGNFV